MANRRSYESKGSDEAMVMRGDEDFFSLFSTGSGHEGDHRTSASDQQPEARNTEACGPNPGAERLLEHLNPPQREAVLHEGSPVLVVAGAGSGKTRVLTRRIAWLVAERQVHPGSILAITFTNKAAAEMRSRVGDLVGGRARLMWVCTFHSACVRILRQEIDKFGLRKTFSIYDDTDARRLMGLVLKDLNVDPKKVTPRSALNWVSDQKNDLRDPDAAAQRVREQSEANGGRRNDLAEVLGQAYAQYQRRLSEANALDFDDLIMMTVTLFQMFPQVREQYRRRFRQVLVDEYQDTNHAQYQLIRMLCGPWEPDSGMLEGTPLVEAPELMVVGDSDQSIYAFRGATIRNILDFEQDFPGARTIKLEQNYRSTQTILSAANAVIQNNSGRPAKTLWSDAGDGALITGYVADDESSEAQFVADEIDALREEHGLRYGQCAVFYRTNAQSGAFEEVFIRRGIPYRVIGGVRFYERKEIRDALAYLRAIANPDDEVSLRRIINEPKRGIGARAQASVDLLGAGQQIGFSQALAKVDQVPGIATRSRTQIEAFVAMLERHRAMMRSGEPADAILTSILNESGMLTALQTSGDPQDETRIENLVEFTAIAAEFVAGAATMDLDVNAPDLAGGMPEPDVGLTAFLERVALVADADALPDGEDGDGVVTLMTLHTAKGLEFDTVFLTGFEESLFPHERSMNDPEELAEERRLAYVGITRARQRLYLSRSGYRTAFGQPRHNPESRFVKEIPEHLVDWRRLGSTTTNWATQASGRTQQARSLWQEFDSAGTGRAAGTAFGAGRGAAARPVPSLAPGDRVLHASFGLGTVTATGGTGDGATADIDFGSLGTKRFMLKHAPIEKL